MFRAHFQCTEDNVGRVVFVTFHNVQKTAIKLREVVLIGIVQGEI